MYEDGHSSNDEDEPDFYLEDDGAGGFRRIYQDSYYTRDDGQRIYTDGHESNDDDTATGLNPAIANVSFLNPTVTLIRT
jgi:hypothetical protein